MGDHTGDSNYAAWTGDRIMLCNLGIYDRIYTGRDHRFNDRDDHDAELYLSPIFYHGFCRMYSDYGMEDLFENGAVGQRQEESWKTKQCHLHKNMQETGSDSTGSYDIF